MRYRDVRAPALGSVRASGWKWGAHLTDPGVHSTAPRRSPPQHQGASDFGVRSGWAGSASTSTTTAGSGRWGPPSANASSKPTLPSPPLDCSTANRFSSPGCCCMAYPFCGIPSANLCARQTENLARSMLAAWAADHWGMRSPRAQASTTNPRSSLRFIGWTRPSPAAPSSQLSRRFARTSRQSRSYPFGDWIS